MSLEMVQQDAFSEVINVGIGRAGSMLSDLVAQRIELHVPEIRVCTIDELEELLAVNGELLDTSIYQDFRGPLNGRAILGFPRDSGLKLGQILAGLDETPDELDVDLSGILVEVGNIVMNGVLGSIANMFESQLSYTVPELSVTEGVMQLAQVNWLSRSEIEQTVIYSDAHFSVAGTDVHGSLVLIFRLREIENAISSLLLASA